MELRKGLFARFAGGSASLRKRKKVISMIMGFIQAGRNGAFDREESRKEIGYGNL